MGFAGTGEVFAEFAHRCDRIEVGSGLQPGDRVIGKGAILLQPLVLKALHEE